MASLTGTKIKNTYDGLLKTNDNEPLDAALITITDGLGNGSALSLSSVAAQISGDLDVTGNFDVNGSVINFSNTNGKLVTNLSVVTENIISSYVSSTNSDYEKIRISSEQFIVNTGSGTTSTQRLVIAETGLATFANNVVVDGTLSVGSFGVFDSSVTADSVISTEGVYQAGSGAETGLMFPALDEISLKIDNTERLGLDSTGASVTGTLAVTGDASFNIDTLFVDASNNRVGINTIITDGKLTISRTGLEAGVESGISLKDENGTTRGGLGTDGAVDNNLQVLGLSGIKFHTNNVDGTANERMRIHSTGDISFRDSSVNQAFYWDASSASLGIGTASLASGRRLTLNGSAQFRSDAGSGASFNIIPATNGEDGVELNLSYYTGSGYGPMKFITGGSESMRIDSSGNVGIGTNDPLSILSDFSSSARGLAISNTYPFLALNDTDGGKFFVGTQANIAYIWNSGTSSMIFGTNAAEKMRIDSSGNVGIGTAPATGFHNQTVSNTNAAGRFNTKLIDASSVASGVGAGISLGYQYQSGSFVDGATIQVFKENATSGNFASGLAFTTRVNGGDLTERMRIDSSGNVGIGTSPSYKLHINSGTDGISAGIAGSTYGIRFDNGGAFSLGMSTIHGVDSTLTSSYQPIMINGSDVRFATNATERMRIDSSGNARFGDGNNFNPLIQYAGSGRSASSPGYSFFGDLDTGMFSPNTSNTIAFTTGGTERMRITTGGDVYVGKEVGTYTTDGVSLSNIGSNMSYTDNVVLAINRNGTDGGAIAFYKAGSSVGSISVTASATAFNTSSDYRLKEDWVAMEGALDRVDALKPINFAWKLDGSRVDGFLAHELQEVVPEAVTGEKDATEIRSVEVSPAVYEDVIHPSEEAILDEEGNVTEEAKEEWVEKVLVSEAVFEDQEFPVYQGIDQSKIVPLLVAAIQELRAELNALKQA